MGVAVHRTTVMRTNHSHDPVQMHDAGTVVTAALVVTLAAAGLVLVVQTPIVAIAVCAVALAATSTRRLAAQHARRRDGCRQVHVPTTDVSVDG